MTLTWKYNSGGGDVTLPYPENPNGFTFDSLPLVAAWRTMDGTHKQQYFAVKIRASVSWKALTQAERNTVRTMFTAGSSGSLTVTFPDTQALTMITGANAYTESETWSGETPYYAITLTLEQV